MTIGDLDNLDVSCFAEPIPRTLPPPIRNPRPPYHMTDDERRAFLAELRLMHDAITKIATILRPLPFLSPTLSQINEKLRTNDDGSRVPTGAGRHPAGEELEEYEQVFDEITQPLTDFFQSRHDIEEPLAELMARLEPWSPTR
jgi:hypothetical protein